MSNDTAKYDVLIKQYLRSVLHISVFRRNMCYLIQIVNHLLYQRERICKDIAIPYNYI